MKPDLESKTLSLRQLNLSYGEQFGLITKFDKTNLMLMYDNIICEPNRFRCSAKDLVVSYQEVINNRYNNMGYPFILRKHIIVDKIEINCADCKVVKGAIYYSKKHNEKLRYLFNDFPVLIE